MKKYLDHKHTLAARKLQHNRNVFYATILIAAVSFLAVVGLASIVLYFLGAA